MTKTLSHADLMDRTYRYQRLIYDITRRYYLLGRDRLLLDLDPPKGARVLEVACGTGRNLARVRALYPDCALFGLDISDEMLRSARGKLGLHAQLVQADASSFDGAALFGAEGFDRVLLSYSLSMIPEWEAALRLAAAQLRPGGSLHVVDFGDQADLPRWFQRLLRRWLARFHVTPRSDLEGKLQEVATSLNATLTFRYHYRRYAQLAVLTRPG
ncbi:MAG: SAM-dependent methyltransferase [Rhodobacterales bacterium 32-66-7]|nr:MAG: SAM-dependent methyltransferase [Rhodobacterales bacterium 12-65-15]OYX26339.1 MAG: SAM-dependent methyltransferase [Rhodobacterales bacterium 32-66-7]